MAPASSSRQPWSLFNSPPSTDFERGEWRRELVNPFWPTGRRAASTEVNVDRGSVGVKNGSVCSLTLWQTKQVHPQLSCIQAARGDTGRLGQHRCQWRAQVEWLAGALRAAGRAWPGLPLCPLSGGGQRRRATTRGRGAHSPSRDCPDETRCVPTCRAPGCDGLAHAWICLTRQRPCLPYDHCSSPGCLAH